MGNVAIAGAPLGLQHGSQIIRRMFNRTGSTMVKGEVACVDLALLDALTTSYDVGVEGGAYSSMTVALAAVHLLDGTAHLGMAMESIADNAEGDYLFRGKVPFLVPVVDGGADSNLLVGDKMILVTATVDVECNQAATGRIIGYPLNDATVVVTSADSLMYFNGIDWMGAT